MQEGSSSEETSQHLAGQRPPDNNTDWKKTSKNWNLNKDKAKDIAIEPGSSGASR